MSRRGWLRRFVPFLPIVILVVLSLGVTLAQAEAPTPNKLSGNSSFAQDVREVDITQTGAAVNIHGNPIAGRTVYAQSCQPCHGLAAVGGFPNPGSDDGTVPPLNPLDPGFAGDDPTSVDPATFAANFDPFIQHGSTPGGENPAISMPAWGASKKLTQQQIADAEAYIMQLNGVYWPDRWAPPAQVVMRADRTGNTVTYRILLVNEGASDMTQVTLRDTLPAGLTYFDSYLSGQGQNPGKWNGTTVEWDTFVPQGGTTGPFFIVATVQGAGAPANVAEVSFHWKNLAGTEYPTTAVSDPVVANAPVPQARPPAQVTASIVVAKPAATAAPVATAASVATTPPTAQPTPASGQPAVTAAPTEIPTAVPAPTQAPAPTAAPTVTPAPAASAGNATAGAQLFQSRSCVACHTVNGVGGKVGPDLSHIGSTPYDSLPNDAAYLAQWLANPQVVKPGTLMPNPGLSDAEIQDMVAYLTTLQ